ncbi:MAG: late competence development ComFB family protein [Lachnospiraceae bacterium]
MAKRTNKTSHVLNLITNGAATEAEPDAARITEPVTRAASESVAAPKTSVSEAEPKQAPVKTVPTTDKKVIVVDQASENDKLSTEILNHLTNHLEEENNRSEVYHLVNVMEEILNHINLEKHMKNYDLCLCQRCRVDVLALTLTRLPAKYMVVDESTVTPIISFYENKFRVRILTEIVKSCLEIKENPRHGELGIMQSIKNL